MICPTCLQEFEGKRSDQVYCGRKCKRAMAMRKWRRKYPDSDRYHQKYKYYLRRYGLTKEQYDLMFEEQDGKCAICYKHQSELNKALAVDHDHASGKIRGLLCSKCNNAIGLLEDNPLIIKSALEYVS